MELPFTAFNVAAVRVAMIAVKTKAMMRITARNVPRSGSAGSIGALEVSTRLF